MKSNMTPGWVKDYERRVDTKIVYRPESPDARGLAALGRIWNEILPELKERNVAEAPSELPKDVSKWAVLPDWVELLEKHPHTHRNVFDWLDSWVPKQGHTFRSGAATLRRLSGHSVSRAKQYGGGMNDPTPSFTFHGERLPYTESLKQAEKWVRASRARYPDKYVYDLDVESLEDWYKVLGGRCSTYVFAESSILYHGMTPHQETDSPIPWDIFGTTFKETLAEQFPSYGVGKSTLAARHLFVGTSLTGGVTIGNSQGSAGYPYTNMDRDTVREVLNRPKFQGRTTKGTVFPHALRQCVEWIEGGMPMSGPLYATMAQPATLAYRGDRAVHLNIRALASRGQDPSGHDASKRLAAMLPSRSIIIVPTCLVLAQSTWAQPIGDHIAGVATPGFDWVDPAHSVTRLNDVRQLDLQQGGARDIATVGADASGWDRDVTGQFIAGETAWYMSMFEKDQSLLYVDAKLPLNVDSAWVAAAVSDLSAGGERTYEVSGLLPDGSEQMTTVTARMVNFDYWEFITKVMSMINDCPLQWADYGMDAPGVTYNMGFADPAFKDYFMVSNGGRKTGDAATGIGNTWTNLVVTPAAAKMSQLPELSRLRARRSGLQGAAVGGPYEIIDAFARGDDLALAIRLPKGGTVPSEAVASGICSVGMRANAKKQEASDIPGTPVFGFANVVVTEKYMGKLLGRTFQRYMVQESRGLNMEALTAVGEVGNDTEYSDTLIATTGTAKSRLAPLSGFPLMDEHPIVDIIVEFAVHNDTYRLSYVIDGALVDGQITESAKAEMRRAADVEANVQAKLRARRDNVSVNLEALKEVYVGSTIHDKISDVALVDNYRPTLELERVDNHTLFKEAVRLDQPLDL